MDVEDLGGAGRRRAWRWIVSIGHRGWWIDSLVTLDTCHRVASGPDAHAWPWERPSIVDIRDDSRPRERSVGPGGDESRSES